MKRRPAPSLMAALLTAAMALPMLVLYAVGAAGPFLLADLELGLSSLGLLTTVCFTVAAVLSLRAGRAVDRIGPRSALVAMFAVTAASFGALSLSQGVATLALAVGVCGLAQALANPATNKLIADLVPEGRRASVVGLKQSGVQMAALVAGSVLPPLIAWLGWRPVFALVVPVALALAVAALLVLPAPSERSTPASGGFVRPNGALVRLMALQLCVGSALAAFATFLPTFAHTGAGLGESNAGLLLAVFGAAGIASRIVLTPMAARAADLSRFLAALCVLAAVSVLAVASAPLVGTVLLWVGAAGTGATAVAANAIAMAALVRDRTYGPVAPASGYASSAFFAGFAVGPPLAGAVADSAGGFTTAWTGVASALVLGACCALLLGRWLRAGRGSGEQAVHP